MTKKKLPKIVRCLMKGVFVFMLISILFGGCSYINKKSGLEDDWFGEEFFEEIIENELGVDFDLTPDSKE